MAKGLFAGLAIFSVLRFSVFCDFQCFAKSMTSCKNPNILGTGFELNRDFEQYPSADDQPVSTLDHADGPFPQVGAIHTYWHPSILAWHTYWHPLLIPSFTVLNSLVGLQQVVSSSKRRRFVGDFRQDGYPTFRACF